MNLVLAKLGRCGRISFVWALVIQIYAFALDFSLVSVLRIPPTLGCFLVKLLELSLEKSMNTAASVNLSPAFSML